MEHVLGRLNRAARVRATLMLTIAQFLIAIHVETAPVLKTRTKIISRIVDFPAAATVCNFAGIVCQDTQALEAASVRVLGVRLDSMHLLQVNSKPQFYRSAKGV